MAAAAIRSAAAFSGCTETAERFFAGFALELGASESSGRECCFGPLPPKVLPVLALYPGLFLVKQLDPELKCVKKGLLRVSY